PRHRHGGDPARAGRARQEVRLAEVAARPRLAADRPHPPPRVDRDRRLEVTTRRWTRFEYECGGPASRLSRGRAIHDQLPGPGFSRSAATGHSVGSPATRRGPAGASWSRTASWTSSVERY